MDAKLRGMLLRFPGYSEAIMKHVEENDDFEKFMFRS